MSYRHSYIFLFFLLLTLNTYSQHTIEVENNVFVEFPIEPEYKATIESSSYVAGTENCIFMVIIQKDQIPNYKEFATARRNWTEAEYKSVVDVFLDNAVEGKLAYTGNTGDVTELKKGEFYGRLIVYSAINPLTGVRGKRYTVMMLVRDRVVNFECWYLHNEDKASISEKNSFLNSISVK